jgi:branched-chain amino acid transport system ATP-binding protein
MNELLIVDNITKNFGGLQANKNISFTVNSGEIIGLIGPNGAGKTTLFNCIACFYNPDHGKIFFKGSDISQCASQRNCQLGIGRTFQIVRIFKDMTVLENIMIGAFLRNKRTRDARQKAMDAATIFGFANKLEMKASSLTIAEQKRLEVARAFATSPQLLLLDETMAGLNSQEVKESVELVLKLRERGITLILVEHVMEGIMSIADRVIVLDDGEKIAEGSPRDVINNDKVIQAYFGDKYHAKRREFTTSIQ